jgi:very-short-patch-repair endonuclease
MQGQTNNFTKPAAKQLRKTLTDAERKLWHRLRGEQLGAKFRRQHPFENYVLDFVCLDRRLVVEVDGSQHADNLTYDIERTARLQSAGFSVLRFWNNQVLNETDAVVKAIWDALNPSPPQPSP